MPSRAVNGLHRAGALPADLCDVPPPAGDLDVLSWNERVPNVVRGFDFDGPGRAADGEIDPVATIRTLLARPDNHSGQLAPARTRTPGRAVGRRSISDVTGERLGRGDTEGHRPNKAGSRKHAEQHHVDEVSRLFAMTR